MLIIDWGAVWRRMTGRRQESPHPDARALWLAQLTPFGIIDLTEYAVLTFRKGLTDARALEWLLNAQRFGQRMHLNSEGVLVLAVVALIHDYVTDDPAGDAEAAVKGMEHAALDVADWRD